MSECRRGYFRGCGAYSERTASLPPPRHYIWRRYVAARSRHASQAQPYWRRDPDLGWAELLAVTQDPGLVKHLLGYCHRYAISLYQASCLACQGKVPGVNVIFEDTDE